MNYRLNKEERDWVCWVLLSLLDGGDLKRPEFRVLMRAWLKLRKGAS